MLAVPINPADAVVLFIDLQDGLLELSRTVDVAHLRTAAGRLAKLARIFEIPVVVSTVPLEHVRVESEITEALGHLDHHVPGRTLANAFEHTPTADKFAELGRKTLLVAGVLTEVSVQYSALSGVDRGYNVQVVIDACGGLSTRTEEAALRQLAQAGVATTSCAYLAGQLASDITQFVWVVQ